MGKGIGEVIMSSTSKVLVKDIPVGETVDSLELNKNFEREYWVILLMRGIALVAFGLVASIWPGITLVSLAYVFSVFLLVAGILDIVNGFRSISSKNLWFLKIALGLAEIGIGLYLLRQGFVISTIFFLQVIGLTMIMQCFVEIITAFKSDSTKGLKALMIFGGIINFIIGIALIRFPVTAGITYVWLIGLYGLVGGSMTIAGAFSIRPPKAA